MLDPLESNLVLLLLYLTVEVGCRKEKNKAWRRYTLQNDLQMFFEHLSRFSFIDSYTARRRHEQLF